LLGPDTSDASSGPFTAPDTHPHPEPRRRKPFRTPLNFFVAGVLFFVLGLIAAPFVIGEAIEFFYQPMLLALVHSLTLGWITATIMGVMYRYVPSLTHTRIRFPRLAVVQFALYMIGVLGMVSHFAGGAWVGLWCSAMLVVLSVILFAINLVPCLTPKIGAGIAETGMLLAIGFLLVAASWGLIVGLDKSFNFLGGDLLSNLGGHVALAAAGWVSLAICAVSYRMIPAFTLPSITLPRAALAQLAALALGAASLSVILIARGRGAMLGGVLIAAALIAYIAITVRMAVAHRVPIDWTARHALCGLVWLMVACVLGLLLDWAGADTVIGNRAAGAFAVTGLLGWAGNFIIGMSYALFPGMVARVRSEAGWPAQPTARLLIAGPRQWVWAVYNLGVAFMAAGLAVGNAMLAELGAAACAAAALPYAAAALATLAGAYREGRTG
jgi:hypothetical protein